MNDGYLDASPTRPEYVDLAELAKREPRPREWYVDDLIPAFANVLMSAHGGLGKSLLSLQLGACIAAGRPFFGLLARRARVMLLSCEDDIDEIHRRLRSVCAALDVDMVTLTPWLQIFDAVGIDCALYGRRAALTDDGRPIYTAAPDATEMFDWLRDRVQHSGTEVLILDSLSDTYDASEIERAPVRRYMTLCLSLIRHCRGCVIHVGHIDKAAAKGSAFGQTYSGSTAWNNSVRTRIALTVPNGNEPGEPRTEDDGRRLLVVEKTNYGRPGLTIALRYDNDSGVFVRDGDPLAGNMIGAIRDRSERRAILRLLIECERISRNVMTPQRANGNAATILGEMDGYPKALKAGLGRKRLWSHLRRLEDESQIRAEPFKTPAGHRTERWKVTQAGQLEASSQ